MGNKLGWILSGALVLGLAAVIIVLALGSSSASPTTLAITKPGFFEMHEVKLSPASFLGAEPSGAGNAADDYKKAVEVQRAHVDDFRDAMTHEAEILKGTYTLPGTVLDALEQIYTFVAAGAAKKEMRYTTPDLIVVRYANDQGTQLIRVADQLALLSKVYDGLKRFEEEEKVLRAMFILGWHMAKEDVRATMVIQGLEVQGGALSFLSQLYPNPKWNPQKYAALEKPMLDYINALNKVHHEYESKLWVLWRPIPNPGDVFAVVAQDKDRAWRVEGLLVIGAIRFTHSKSAGDQSAGKELIEKYAKDPDPFVKAAATAAQNLTEDGFKIVGFPPAT